MRVLGIDEAGRGCVLGPLVVAGFLCDGVDDAQLLAAGAADSKQLSAARRDEARRNLAPLGRAWVHRIDAAAIDAGNLNTLEEQAIAAIIRAARPDRVIVDALGHPRAIPRTVERIRRAAGIDPEVIMEPKADARYPVVGAASIVAKTTRDAAIAAYAATHGAIGSGYPSDPGTRAWLAAWRRSGEPWPAFVRTRWGTIRAMAQQSLL